ncbi:STAS domain-containing protein [Geodermatophilus sp. SYSU D01186]
MGYLRGGGDEPPSGSFEVVHEVGGPVLHLRGDVDAPLVHHMRDAGLDEGTIVAVHVAGMAYIDSSGLALLAGWAQQAAGQGRPAVVRHAGPRFRQVLDLTGLAPLFVLEGTAGA